MRNLKDSIVDFSIVFLHFPRAEGTLAPFFRRVFTAWGFNPRRADDQKIYSSDQ